MLYRRSTIDTAPILYSMVKLNEIPTCTRHYNCVSDRSFLLFHVFLVPFVLVFQLNVMISIENFVSALPHSVNLCLGIYLIISGKLPHRQIGIYLSVSSKQPQSVSVAISIIFRGKQIPTGRVGIYVSFIGKQTASARVGAVGSLFTVFGGYLLLKEGRKEGRWVGGGWVGRSVGRSASIGRPVGKQASRQASKILFNVR